MVRAKAARSNWMERLSCGSGHFVSETSGHPKPAGSEKKEGDNVQFAAV
ncbi:MULTISPECIES: hypothetical protein [Brevibacillus]|nr:MULTISPECIES: hypothetical protein [Brevibacillus]